MSTVLQAIGIVALIAFALVTAVVLFGRWK